MNLADYTDLTPDQRRQRAKSSDPRAKQEQLEVYGLFASEYDYRPVDVRSLPLGEFALEFGKPRTKPTDLGRELASERNTSRAKNRRIRQSE